MKTTFQCMFLVFFAHVPTTYAEKYVFEGNEVTIPQKGPANPSLLQVSGVEGVVKNISVKLESIRHSYGQDIMIAVSNPNGGTTLLFDAPRCRIEGVDLVFADDATENLQQACSNTLAAGRYLPGYSPGNHQFTIPIAPLRPFYSTMDEMILANPNGRWILWAEDFISGSGGTIDSWQIIFETE